MQSEAEELEAAARCDSEAANIITLNMMHEIVTGRKSVEEARKEHADSMMAYTLGREAPYAERLRFEVQRGGTEDPGEDMGIGPMLRQGAGKIKDVVTGEEEGRSAA